MKAHFLTAAVLVHLLAFQGCTSLQDSRGVEAGWKRFESEGFFMAYPEKEFLSAELKTLPRKVETPDVMSWAIGPRRWAIILHPAKSPPGFSEPRYYFPSESLIYITPLRDRSVPDFAIAYSQLFRNAENLRILLSEPRDYRPWVDQRWYRTLPPGLPGLPDEPFNNAGRMLMAKFRLLSSPQLRGFRLLTYYANAKTGYGATNAELTYDFQGITNDNRFYVSARIGVRHPSLPENMDDPRAASKGTEREGIKEQARVNSWSDQSFVPALATLDRIISSLRISEP